MTDGRNAAADRYEEGFAAGLRCGAQAEARLRSALKAVLRWVDKSYPHNLRAAIERAEGILNGE